MQLICKQDGIIAGLPVFERVFHLTDPKTEVFLFVEDGAEVKNGQQIGEVHGDIRVLLSAERTALNFLQRMSGIATYTHESAKLLEGTKTKLLDTRKTTPNMRVFEKYAVKVGGGYNHRYNLSDGVLLKIIILQLQEALHRQSIWLKNMHHLFVRSKLKLRIWIWSKKRLRLVQILLC